MLKHVLAVRGAVKRVRAALKRVRAALKREAHHFMRERETERQRRCEAQGSPLCAHHYVRPLTTAPGALKCEADEAMLEEEAKLATRLPAIKLDTKGQEKLVAVCADNLTKTYRPRNAPATWACRGVSLQVDAGCVYGLLGPNGAGKSTIMSMLTGIETADSGDGFINGSSITSELETARRSIGLCPQFDALMDNLTAREHLVLLADIRGVPKQLVRRVVERAIVDMSLTEKAGAVSKTYSGGNKRKLSVAMSIVANPKVTFLDEPSTGMDVETRRLVYISLIYVSS